MPELLEAEMYRRSLSALVGGRITSVSVADALVVPDATALTSTVVGATVTAVRRHGKVVLVDTDRVTVGLRFGMTGRVIVGEDDRVPQLAYGPRRDDERFDRWEMRVRLGGAREVGVRLSDSRRLARVVLDPDLSALGPDATVVDASWLAARLEGRRAPIKAMLLDQRVVAGLGNLLADEVLWRVGVAPHRPCSALTEPEIEALVAMLPAVLDQLMERGGSHCGDLAPPLRRPGALCPLDGAVLVRRNIGGRTSWSCPLHQR